MQWELKLKAEWNNNNKHTRIHTCTYQNQYSNDKNTQYTQRHVQVHTHTCSMDVYACTCT